MITWNLAPYTGTIRTCPRCTGHRLRTCTSFWQTDKIRVTYIKCQCGYRFKLTETKPDLPE